jgi:hypothetical protein
MTRKLKLLILLAGFSAFCAACGTAPVEEATPTESALAMNYVGGKQCWTATGPGQILTYVQPATVTYVRSAFGLPSRYVLTVTKDPTVGPTPYPIETMGCDSNFNLWGYGAPTCNAGSFCNADTSNWVSCAIYRKNVGETTYHYSRTGWVDYRQANFLPSSPSSPTTFQGTYQLVFYSNWYSAEGPNGCPGGTSTTNHYDFH